MVITLASKFLYQILLTPIILSSNSMNSATIYREKLECFLSRCAVHKIPTASGIAFRLVWGIDREIGAIDSSVLLHERSVHTK